MSKRAKRFREMFMRAWNERFVLVPGPDETRKAERASLTKRTSKIAMNALSHASIDSLEKKPSKGPLTDEEKASLAELYEARRKFLEEK